MYPTDEHIRAIYIVASVVAYFSVAAMTGLVGGQVIRWLLERFVYG